MGRRRTRRSATNDPASMRACRGGTSANCQEREPPLFTAAGRTEIFDLVDAVGLRPPGARLWLAYLVLTSCGLWLWGRQAGRDNVGPTAVVCPPTRVRADDLGVGSRYPGFGLLLLLEAVLSRPVSVVLEAADVRAELAPYPSHG